MSQLSSLSTMYVKVPISVTANGAPYNPTGDSVWLAFLAEGTNPSSGDWKVGSWETVDQPGGSVVYLARALVGPNGGVITLDAGSWRVWVKVQDSPETPILTSDMLVIY